ncbi:polyphenol oxidase family protein [Bacteriovorax sp. Seq25_V]|uniref:polyphenol oxidase family protein n=1 Tax=Bacteriovorax sp. Seq25_V TaxID=1201288 RepID=UPI00038A548E|nr:polyphenol oxidase family protein [Bacteriovorax sp. Seq25_V]EQC45652.1 multi-copper polyphenol oxidoreductase laccase [Bacteriovorax sp. Seq25_V]
MKIIQKEIDSYIFEVYSDRPQISFKAVNQVHGNIIFDCHEELLDADGVVCTCGQCTLAIKTADCLPIAIIGKKGHALIHAGWRGLENKIIKNDLIRKILPTQFFIGPHIGVDAYQVSDDFLNYFEKDKFITKDGRYHFSLEKEATEQILDKYPNAVVQYSNACTFSDHRYNSYRRNKTDLRNWNILRKG